MCDWLDWDYCELRNIKFLEGDSKGFFISKSEE